MYTGNPGTWEVEAKGSEGFKASLGYMLVSSKQNQTKLKCRQTKYPPTDKWENKFCLAIRSRIITVIPALMRLARKI